MWRPMLLFEAQRRSSRTVDPEVCLPAFHWKGLTWSSAKTPTGSGSDSSLSLHSSQLVGRGLHFWVFLIRRFYSRDVRASGILNGDVEPPHECSDLYHILEEYTEAYTADWTSKNMRPKVTEAIIEITSCFPGDNWCSVCFVLPVFWSSIQTSSSSSAESISQLQATSSKRWQWCLTNCHHLLLLKMLKVLDYFYEFRCDYWKEKRPLPEYLRLQVWYLE